MGFHWISRRCLIQWLFVQCTEYFFPFHFLFPFPMTSIAREPQASMLPARGRITILEILLPAEPAFEISIRGTRRSRVGLGRATLVVRMLQLVSNGCQLFLFLHTWVNSSNGDVYVSSERGGPWTLRSAPPRPARGLSKPYPVHPCIVSAERGARLPLL